MEQHLTVVAALFTTFSLTGFLLAFVACPRSGQTSLAAPASQSTTELAPEIHAYHKEPPPRPLPRTLDRRQFPDNTAAFVAYSVAAKIRKLLYQEPCYCGCDKTAGHESLLDCFTTNHGHLCHACQLEALFCFKQHEDGRTAAEIREAMAKGEVWKLNLDRYIEMYFARYKPHAR